MMKLLLHVCCGPDVTVALERLPETERLTLFFDNPNIHPYEEYQRRVEALEKVAAHFGVDILFGKYDPERWHRMIAGLEDEPEGGRRCRVCIAHRLRNTAREAKANGFDTIASVFSTSPHKDAQWVNAEGEKIAEEYGLRHWATNFKKKDGFKRSVQLSRELGIYRQNYCGCVHSQRNSGGKHRHKI
jgi:predicted adenine nucleotide alpha hydrolase (AANH) superfamily ATPase